MKLEDLYRINFLKASPEAQAEYVTRYRKKRAEDMEKPPSWPKVKKTKVKKKQPPLTTEEKAIMELLGLKKKEVIAMRNLKGV